MDNILISVEYFLYTEKKIIFQFPQLRKSNFFFKIFNWLGIIPDNFIDRQMCLLWPILLVHHMLFSLYICVAIFPEWMLERSLKAYCYHEKLLAGTGTFFHIYAYLLWFLNDFRWFYFVLELYSVDRRYRSKNHRTNLSIEKQFAVFEKYSGLFQPLY